MKSKKGVELGLNAVVVAALAIIVLIVVVFIFINGIKGPQQSFFDCGSRDGECLTDDECGEINGKVDFTGRCPEEEVCCLFGDK